MLWIIFIQSFYWILNCPSSEATYTRQFSPNDNQNYGDNEDIWMYTAQHLHNLLILFDKATTLTLIIYYSIHNMHCNHVSPQKLPQISPNIRRRQHQKKQQ